MAQAHNIPGSKCGRVFWSHPPSFPPPATALAAAERRTTEIISVKTAALLGAQDLGSSGPRKLRTSEARDLGSSGAEDNKERGESSKRRLSLPVAT